MATQTVYNQKDSFEVLEGKKPPVDSKHLSTSSSSLFVMNLSASQLLESVGVSPESDEEVDVLTLLEERQKEEKSEQESGKGLSADKTASPPNQKMKTAAPSSSTPPPSTSGENAVFVSAGMMSTVSSKGTQQMIQRLLDQLNIGMTELQEIEGISKSWQQVLQSWEQYIQNPSPTNLQQFTTAVANFVNAVAATGITNSQFQHVMQMGQTSFMDQIRKILVQVMILELLVGILEGGQKNGMSVVFKMQSVLMSLEQMAVENNSKEQKQQSEIAETTINGLSESYKKMIKEFQKSSESHSIFSWIGDFFKSIGTIFVNFYDICADMASGNWSQAGEDFLKATGIESIITAFKEGVLQGIESLLTAAILMVVFMGPQGMAFMGTSFGKDLDDAVALVVDAVVSLNELFYGGMLKAFGDDKGSKTLFDNAKKLGEQMLENPDLKAISQIAEVAVMAFSIITGQVWLTVLMVGLFVMQETGALTDLTNELAKGIADIPGLKNMGQTGQDIAKVIADVVVLLVVTALSFGAGSAAAAGDVVADDAASTADQLGSQVASAESDAADDTLSQIKAKLSEIVQKIKNIPSAVGTRGGMTLLGAGSTLASSSLGSDIASLVADTDSKANKEKLELILMIVQEVFAAVMSIVGGMGAATGSASSDESAATQKLRQFAPKLVQYFQENAASFAEFGGRVMAAGNGVSSISDMMQGGSQILMGRAQEAIARLQGDVELFQAAQEQNNAAISNTSAQLKAIMQGFAEIIKTFMGISLPGLGVANALSEN